MISHGVGLKRLEFEMTSAHLWSSIRPASWAVLYRRLSPPYSQGVLIFTSHYGSSSSNFSKSPVVVSRSHSASLKSCIRQVTDGKVSRGQTLHVNISFRATSWQINGFDGLQTPSLASYLICCLWIPDRSPDCPCVYQTQTQPMGRSRLSIQYCLLRK